MATLLRKHLPPRLKTASEFRRAQHYGKHFRHGFLRLTISRQMRQAPLDSGPGENKSRVGFAVPERAVKSSVKRNRVKRLLREAVRTSWQWMPSGYDMVLTVNCLPKVDHALYVEGVFISLLLESAILAKRGEKALDERLSAIPTEFRDSGRGRDSR